ncbi:MAG TPA: flagellar biosynthetic protein FliR [Trinickia sp.]|uniref:EscT/YscT/HrcT family type III secretion system export apparatus protein n=1 Tax=Trinickia sp. TaxID=2571163 RepID=UPI002D18BDA4|nr:flagellar biosynthetic protein FliR [Trinickia sp.]HTI19196.1 flagellar biosynthetic protein FliR [Trinickia sp.]
MNPDVVDMAETAAIALPFVLAAALATARWLPTLLLVPVFTLQSFSVATRGSIALALGLPVALALLPDLQTVPPSFGMLVWLTTKEIALGLLLAVSLSIPLWAVEAAGAYIDYQRGANPQALDPMASPDASLVGLLLQRTSCVYLMHAGAFHALLGVVYASFAAWPTLLPAPRLETEAWDAIAELLTSLLRFALMFSLPYLLALGLIEACFAVLSRAAARFPAYVAALPFKSIVALWLIALSLPASIEAIHDVHVEHLEWTAQTIKATSTAAPNEAVNSIGATCEKSPSDHDLGSPPCAIGGAPAPNEAPRDGLQNPSRLDDERNNPKDSGNHLRPASDE